MLIVPIASAGARQALRPQESAHEFDRLYLGAGMGHCAGLPGPGPHQVDVLAALVAWVERGQAPESIVVSSPASGMKRPLCPWPEKARYTGTGSTDDDRNFRCTADSEPARSDP